MKLHGPSAPRLIVGLLMSHDAKDVIAALRPRELTYLCELCAILDDLGVCADVFDDDDDDDNDEED